jgi:hypothetical protein
VPVAVRLVLPGYAFISWNGLFADPRQLSPPIIGIAVSLAWAVVATARFSTVEESSNASDAPQKACREVSESSR